MDVLKKILIGKYHIIVNLTCQGFRCKRLEASRVYYKTIHVPLYISRSKKILLQPLKNESEEV